MCPALPLLFCRRDWPPGACYRAGVARTPCTALPWAAFTVNGLRAVNASAGKPLDCAAPAAPAFDAAKVSPAAKADLSCYAASFQGE